MVKVLRDRLHPLALLAAWLAVTFPLWCNAYLAPPDSACYFAVARSLVRGLDLDFRDDYATMEFTLHLTYLTPVDRLSNDWPMGSGIVWTPAYAAADLVARATPDGPTWPVDRPDRVAGLPPPRTLGHDEPLLAPTGQSGLYKLAISLQMAVAAWLAMALAWRTARDNAGRWNALAGVVIVFLGTPVVFYTYAYAMMSHVNSLLLVGGVLAEWHRTRPDRTGRERTPGEWWRLGLLAGAMALVRPQDVVCLAPFVVEMIARRRELAWGAWGRGVGIAAGASLLAFSPQVILWQRVYGHALQFPKIEEMHWLAPALGEFLFSPYHGLLAWSPVATLVVPGCVLLARRDAVLAVAIAVMVLVQVYLNAANEIWWAGGSFGARRMVAVGVPMMVAMAALVAHARWTLALAVPLVVWNLLLMARERAGLLSLMHYEPWDGAFVLDVLSMAEPRAFLVAMMGDFAGFGWPTRLATMALGLAGASLIQRRWHLAPRGRAVARGCLAIALAWLMVAPVVVLVAALRTGTHPIDTWERPPYRDNRSLWDGYYEYGFYQFKRGRLDEAAAAYERAAELLPQRAQPWRYLATIELQREDGDPERALALAEEALRRDPRYVGAWEIARAAAAQIAERDPSRAFELNNRLLELGREIDIDAVLRQ